MSALRTAHGFRNMALTYLRSARADGVEHAEILLVKISDIPISSCSG
jgi:hypothetical protein